MTLISRLRDQRFCAFCRSPRKIYAKKHVGPTNVLGLLMVSLAISEAAWEGPDPRVVVLFSVLIASAEVFIYLRWRAALACRLCGFDPVIYKKSPAQASEMVNAFFRAQSENPGFWLTKSPLLDVHRRLREDQRRRDELVVARAAASRRAAMRATALATAARGRASVNPASPASAAGQSVNASALTAKSTSPRLQGSAPTPSPR